MLPPDDFTTNGDALSGVMPVPNDDEDYECINATYDGPCKSGERVTRQYAACSKCIALGMQATLALDAGVHGVNDYQYDCANDRKLGGSCTSGEKVSRANAKCSYCTANRLSNPVINSVVTPEESLASQDLWQT